MGCAVVKPKKSELSILFSSWSSRFPPLSLICFITLHHGRWRVIKSKSTKGYLINSPIRKWFTVFCVIVKITKLVEVKRTFFFFMSWHLPGIAISHPFHKHQVQDIYSEAYTHMLYKSLKNISQTKATTELWFPTTAKKQFSDGEFIKECLLVWCIPIYVWILISHTGQCGGHTDVARKK